MNHLNIKYLIKRSRLTVPNNNKSQKMYKILTEKNETIQNFKAEQMDRYVTL